MTVAPPGSNFIPHPLPGQPSHMLRPKLLLVTTSSRPRSRRRCLAELDRLFLPAVSRAFPCPRSGKRTVGGDYGGGYSAGEGEPVLELPAQHAPDPRLQ
jgi:hypothetical protein